jgi:hypothetical protein
VPLPGVDHRSQEEDSDRDDDECGWHPSRRRECWKSQRRGPPEALGQCAIAAIVADHQASLAVDALADRPEQLATSRVSAWNGAAAPGSRGTLEDGLLPGCCGAPMVERS